MTASKKPTLTEATESLTGFEEIAIQRAFDGDLSTLTGTMMMRALVYIYKLRDSNDSIESKNAAMKMSLKEVNDFFDLSSNEGND